LLVVVDYVPTESAAVLNQPSGLPVSGLLFPT
jgi:hypothetical protein